MDDISSHFERLRDRHLDTILEIVDLHAQDAFGSDSALLEMLRYHLKTGGKRLRALIPLRLAEVCGLPSLSSLNHFAAACEVLHNATLVHDDLQDGDQLRRGKLTVWKKYGSASAINLGDAMFYLAISIVNNIPNVGDPNTIVNDFLRNTFKVIDGQEREFLLHRVQLPTWEEYFSVVRGKTSALFTLPIEGAARCIRILSPDDTELSVEHEGQLALAASHLGLLFQLQDDLLDIYGDKGREQPCSDIFEGKLSALVVHTLHALHQEDPSDALWLRNLLRQERETITDSDVGRVLELFDVAHAKEHVLQLIDKQRELALHAIRPVDPFAPSALTEELRSFIASLADLFCKPIESVRS